MCNDPLHRFLTQLPKVEHHVHVEGTLEPELLFALAARNNITLPTTSEPAYASVAALHARYAHFANLDDFLHHYYLGIAVVVTAADFEALAWAYLQRAHAQGVRHVELFFDPQAHTSRGIAYATVAAGLQAARARALRELGLSTLLIPCLLRHRPVAEAAKLVATHLAPAWAAGSLAGVGLCSSERGYPPAPFAPAFKVAGAAGARRTAHAGEEGPPANIAAAIDVLGVERIDHGRTLAEDPALLKRVADAGYLVTLCPRSNLCLGGVARIEDLPVRAFLEAGVKFSINSDDPAYFGGYILENYCAVQEAFHLSKDEWMRIAAAAIEGSWCEEARKIALRCMLAEAARA